MSLDLYIKTSTPVIKRGTGVYVREDGKTKELKTMAEVKERFPDADLSRIKVFEYETDEVWHENITHNMNKMADQVPIGKHTLYDYLWRPDEIEITHITREYATAVFNGVMYMKEHKEELLPFEPPIDPETGTRWGSYDLLVGFCTSLVDAIMSIDYTKEEYELYASR